MASTSRTVRVFLSSTFRDFAQERDLLVRKVFPELRRKCRERQVELVDVDLRWGITEAEAQQGKVLPICLAEIDRARPYFMGFIGERYGWTPAHDQYDPGLLIEQPWLEEHRGGRSVTELEMLHGVLNNPGMVGRAFFYFRDPQWSRQQGGAYLSEGPREEALLEQLRQRIRGSGFPVVENYLTPEALAERVRKDLWRLIDEAYPESEMPDALAMERRKHESYSASRLGLYLGGERYFEALDGAMQAAPFEPVLVTGASGGGKSALLANWLHAWGAAHGGTVLIVHHLGCGADAADPVRMAVRLMQEIARVTGDEFKPESDAEKQLDQLPLWLSFASAWAQRSGRELLVVVDGLDKVSERRHLRWFPAFLPPGVKLVVSCLEGEVLEAVALRLPWRRLEVKPLSSGEQSVFIQQYLGRYRKTLTDRQAATLCSHPLCGNPLFLITVLEELRMFGVHEELEQRLGVLLSPPSSKASGEEPTVDDVFEHVLARVEGDLGREALQGAMEALWASRAGLFTDELLAIAELVPAQWAAIQNALDESLYESGGKICFGHDYLRKAVEDRYLPFKLAQKKAHANVASYFDELACTEGVDQRVAEELPWQFARAGLKRRLVDTLTDEAVFEELYDRDLYELIRYWLDLREAPSPYYEKAWVEWRRSYEDPENALDLSEAGFRLAEFLRALGSTSPLLEEMYGQSRDAVGDEGEYEGEARICIENSRGLFLQNQGRFAEAEAVFRGCLSELEFTQGRNAPDTLDAIHNLASSLWRQGKNVEADGFAKEVLAVRLKLFGEHNQRTITVLITCGNIAGALGRADESEAFLCRALVASQKVYGRDSVSTFGIMINLAGELTRGGNFASALDLFKKSMRGFEATLGKLHPDTLRCASGYAKCLHKSGDLEGAKKIFKYVLATREKIFGLYHPSVCDTLHDCALAHEEKGELREAEAFYRMSVRRRNKAKGVSHPDTALSVNSLANLMAKMRDPGRMERVLSQYLKKLDRELPPDADLILQAVNYLGIVKNNHGRLRQALGLLRRRAAASPIIMDGLRYNLACYECLDGNLVEAQRLLSAHLQLHPEKKQQALADPDFTAIRAFIATL